jgi:hypothetical protein
MDSIGVFHEFLSIKKFKNINDTTIPKSVFTKYNVMQYLRRLVVSFRGLNFYMQARKTSPKTLTPKKE